MIGNASLRPARSLAWLALPLVVAVLLAVSRRPPGDPSRGLPEPVDSRVLHDAAQDPMIQGYVRRFEIKGQIVEDVRDRRRTLFEAAAMFRRLDQRPRVRELPDLGDRDEEYCRQVIRWVEAVVEFEGNKEDGTARRLRGELEEALRNGWPRAPQDAVAGEAGARKIPAPPGEVRGGKD